MIYKLLHSFRNERILPLSRLKCVLSLKWIRWTKIAVEIYSNVKKTQRFKWKKIGVYVSEKLQKRNQDPKKIRWKKQYQSHQRLPQNTLTYVTHNVHSEWKWRKAKKSAPTRFGWCPNLQQIKTHSRLFRWNHWQRINDKKC